MPRVPRLLSLAIAAAAIAFPASASAGVLTASAPDCTEGSVGQVFLPFADFANYTPAPGSSAESTTGWNLAGNASIAPGNEPWEVADDGGTSSLRLQAGSQATTDTMCVGIEYPTLRFFAKSSGTGLLSLLLVEAQVETSWGSVLTLPVGTVLPSSSWHPTLPFLVATNLLPLLPGDRTPVRFRFTPVGSGTWSVDDVFVDPYRTR